MKNHPKHHRHHHRHHDISIFNKVDINLNKEPIQPVIQTQNVEAKNKEDGVADCFKALFSCFKH